MSTSAAQLRQSGRYRTQVHAGPIVLQPKRALDIQNALTGELGLPAPFRPMGANSSSTDCTASVGTTIDLSALTRICSIDNYNHTVTVQPGVRIGDLAQALAEHDLEIAAGYDLMGRTVGGAVAGGCIGPAFGDDGAFFSSQVDSMKLFTPAGKPLDIGSGQKNLLRAFRLSYGMLGIIHEITLRVRPRKTFEVKHRRCTFDRFSQVAEKLAHVNVGLKFYLMPFRDRVYLDIRRPNPGTAESDKAPWTVKDWGESTVLPNVLKSISRVVPASNVRYRLIDEISTLTQGIFNNSLVNSGSNATTSSASSFKNSSTEKLYSSTWFFPAADFAIVVQAYREFCLRIHQENGFRCDMPTVGFRVGRDSSALLSPSFDEPVIALRAISTQAKGWEDFSIDFGEFARHWGGSPVFNQTREIPADYPHQVFSNRLDFFRKMRREIDPNNRLMNTFLSQYFL